MGVRTETPPLPASSPPPPPPASPQPTGDPASQLVTELFESIKLKSDDKQNSSKPPPAPVSAQKETKTPAVTDFKAGLRKVNQHPLSHEKQEANNTSQINFKSQLKKTNTSLYAQPTSLNPESKEDESEPGRVDFKSQLKKVKSKPSSNSDLNSDAPDKSQDLTNVKASLRSVSKHNIYAAPTSVPPKPNISSTKPKLPVAKTKVSNGGAEARADSTDSGLSSSNDKENIMDLSASLENILDSLAREGITKATAMSASDKVGGFHNSCSNIVESIPATGRFRFRSLLAKLENQAKELRSVNISRSNENATLIKELQGTIR